MISRRGVMSKIDMTRSPYPIGSPESALMAIARRAVGGKVAMVERGSGQPVIVSMNPDDSSVVICDVTDDDQEEEN